MVAPFPASLESSHPNLCEHQDPTLRQFAPILCYRFLAGRPGKMGATDRITSCGPVAAAVATGRQIAHRSMRVPTMDGADVRFSGKTVVTTGMACLLLGLIALGTLAVTTHRSMVNETRRANPNSQITVASQNAHL